MFIKVLICMDTMNMHMNMNMHWCIDAVMQWGKSCTHMNMHLLEYELDMSNLNMNILVECNVYDV